MMDVYLVRVQGHRTDETLCLPCPDQLIVLRMHTASIERLARSVRGLLTCAAQHSTAAAHPSVTGVTRPALIS